MTTTQDKTTELLIDHARAQYRIMRVRNLTIAAAAAHAFETSMTELAARALHGDEMAEQFVKGWEYERESI